MGALPLSPKDVNYLNSQMIFNQLTENNLDVSLADDITATETPKLLLDGQGRCYLRGKITIDNAAPTANLPLLNLPEKIIPTQDSFFPVFVERAGAFVANGVKLESAGYGIAGATVAEEGSYAVLPTLTVNGTGSGAVLTPHLKAISFAVSTSQAGVGSYAPADTIELDGGTNSIAAVLNVLTTQLASATIASAGSGGTPGAVTLTGTTGTGTKFQIAGTIGVGGDLESLGAITEVGSYTANPTLLTAEPVTGGGLTGAELDIKMGVLTTSVNIAGNYTAISGVGAQAATSGSGTGAEFDVTWGLLPPSVVSAGNGYDESTTISISESGGGELTPVLSDETVGQLTLINQPNDEDIVHLDNIMFFAKSYA